jgi:hypothetical protein
MRKRHCPVLVETDQGRWPSGVYAPGIARLGLRQSLKQNVLKSGASVCGLNALAPGVFHHRGKSYGHAPSLDEAMVAFRAEAGR